MIHVVIVTFNSAGVIGEALASLPIGLVDAGPWRVVVVDNASTDATADVVAAVLPPSGELVVLPDNRGYAAGINAALAGAGPNDPVLILNPDVRLHEGSVAPLMALLAEDGTGIAVPRLVDRSGVTHLSLRRRPTVLRAIGEAVLGGRRAGRWTALGEVEARADHYDRPHTTAWATGAAMLVAPACRAAVGAWDEKFFLYSEETDYALRAADAGFVVRYTPDASITHVGGDQAVAPSLWALGAANRVELYRRRHGRASGAAYRASVALNEAVRLGRGPTHRSALATVIRGRAGQRLMVASAAGHEPWICFSGQDWWCHNRAHSDFQLMMRVAKQRPVLLVNSMGMRVPRPGKTTHPARRIVRKAASVGHLLRRPVPDLPMFHVFTPLSVPISGSPRWRSANARFVRAQVEVARRWIGIDDPVVMCTLPTSWDVVQDMDRRALVYNRSDKHSAFGEADQEAIRALELDLLRAADVVEYTSHELMAEEAFLTGERAHFLDHGVDLELFRHRPADEEPADLAAIPHPRVGYFGGLNGYQIDFALFERVARALPDAHLVVIGRADAALGSWAELPNVHMLGHRSHEEIPQYGSGFDVAIMPWLDNEWIRYANPIKLKEYLALGLPVVTTPFAEAERYRDLVTITPAGDDFVEAIKRALAGQGLATPEARRSAVADASWDRRAATLVEHVRIPQPAASVNYDLEVPA